jgi:pyruvate,water dikinase
VILQEQVAAQFAGVAFSCFLQGQEANFLIEYTEGLGEDLVQGRVTPSSVQLCRHSGHIKNEHHQGTVLPAATLQKIFQMGMALEKSSGRSVDLEWAVDPAGELFLLQVRAITHDGRLDKFLSNANMNENYPKPVTPFLFSFAAKGYQHYFSQLGEWTGVPKRVLAAAEPALKNILGIHQGRLYYDLTAVRECLGQLPFSKSLIRFWDEFLGIGVVDVPARTNVSRSFLFPLRFLLRFTFFLVVFPGLAARFQRRVQQTLKLNHSGDPMSVRRQQLNDICRIRFQAWGEAALCDAAVMVYSGFLRALLQRCVVPEQLPHWHSRLLSGSGAISTQQLDDLRDLQGVCREFPDLDKLLQNEEWTKAWEHILHSSQYARVRLHVNQWLDRWGTRVSGELMLTETNYFDDPLMLMKLLGKPIAKTERANALVPYRALLPDSYHKDGLHSLVLASLALLLAYPARAAIRARELCRLSQSRLYGALRANLLGTGRILQARGLLSNPDDLFFLTLDELVELLREGSYSIGLTRQTVDLRRQKYLAYQERKVAERIGRRAGRPWFSREIVPSALTISMEQQGDWQQRFGFPASSGFAKGRIRILRSTDECHKLRSGEILVTRETDPGWIVAMGRAAALVVERGGMLSHGAIVARELGIPAVVGLHDITENLQDGMEIEVDGLKGMIRWTNSASFAAGEASDSPSGTMGRLHSC